MNVIVILAFSRIQNMPKVIASFERSKVGLTGTFRVIPVCDTIDQVLAWKGVAWAEPILALKKPGKFMAHHLLNVAFDQLYPVSDAANTIISVWTDDDDLPDSHYRNLEMDFEENKKPFVMVVSMRRWRGGTPFDTLAGDAAHMRVCQAGFEMIYVRADIFQHYRVADNPIGDGFLIEQLFKEIGKDFVFLPSLTVEWNRL